MADSLGVLVVGTLGFDTVTTPAGAVRDELGGSGAYCAVAAAKLAPASLVSAVGEDFPREWMLALERAGVDTRLVGRVPGPSFRWEARYEEGLEQRRTLDLRMNAFAALSPSDIPLGAACLMLAALSPALSAEVLSRMREAERDGGRRSLVACDTMEHWLRAGRETFIASLGGVDLLFVNEEEARLLTGSARPLEAARKVMALGPRYVVVKGGGAGAVLAGPEEVVTVPAWTLARPVDTTGAGDALAGGLLGSVAVRGAEPDLPALAFGVAAASAACESFGPWRLLEMGLGELEERAAWVSARAEVLS